MFTEGGAISYLCDFIILFHVFTIEAIKHYFSNTNNNIKCLLNAVELNKGDMIALLSMNGKCIAFKYSSGPLLGI